MMKVLFVEGFVNERVRGVLRQVFGTADVPMVGYYQEGGWWMQMAYVDAPRDMSSDDLRRIDLDIFEVEEEVFGDNPVSIAAEEHDYVWVLDEPVTIHVPDGEPENSYGEPFQVLGWVFGGNEEDSDDIYQE